MTIRLSGHAKYPEIDATMADAGEYTVRTVYGQGIRLAYANTREEAEQAKRAFELVLAPRFTRDEAIAIVKAHRSVNAVLTVVPMTNARREFIAGLRVALEALAAAGAFLPECSRCETNDSDHFCESMSDLLDAAGIR